MEVTFSTATDVGAASGAEGGEKRKPYSYYMITHLEAARMTTDMYCLLSTTFQRTFFKLKGVIA